MKDLTFQIDITRELSRTDIQGVTNLRKESYFGDPNDHRYSRGGVYRLLTADEIKASHRDEEGSHFAFLYDKKRNVHGYTRFAIVDTDLKAFDERLLKLLPEGADREQRILRMLTIIVNKDIRGKIVEADGERGRASDLLFERRLYFAEEMGCSVAFCDIATAPVANEASIKYVTRNNFENIGVAKEVERAGVNVIFTRYGRVV